MNVILCVIWPIGPYSENTNTSHWVLCGCFLELYVNAASFAHLLNNGMSIFWSYMINNFVFANIKDIAGNILYRIPPDQYVPSIKT